MILWNYVKPFAIYNIYKSEFTLPQEITQYIYSFILEDIKEKIIKSFLETKINKFFLNKEDSFKTFKIYFNQIPYLKLNNYKRIKTKNIILELLNKKSNVKYVFKYYCCNGNRIVFGIDVKD